MRLRSGAPSSLCLRLISHCDQGVACGLSPAAGCKVTHEKARRTDIDLRSICARGGPWPGELATDSIWQRLDLPVLVLYSLDPATLYVASAKTPKMNRKRVALGLFWVKTTSLSGHHSRFGTTYSTTKRLCGCMSIK